MFELLTVVGVALIAMSVIERQRIDKARDGSQRQSQRAGRAGTAGTAEPAVQNLSPTVAVPRDARFAFVAGFGLRPDELRELHVYSHAGRLGEFPKKVSDLLWKLYDNGYAVGEEIMAVLHHDRPLKEGEAIYVAVARNEQSNTTRTVAFLDRVRAC